MSNRAMCFRFLAAAFLGLILVSQGWSDPAKTAAQAKPKHPAFADVLGDTPAIDGFIRLYRKDMRLYAGTRRKT